MDNNMFVKIQYYNLLKYMKITKDISYSEFISQALMKFKKDPELDENKYKLSDISGCLIEEEDFQDFLEGTEKGFLFVLIDAQTERDKLLEGACSLSDYSNSPSSQQSTITIESEPEQQRASSSHQKEPEDYTIDSDGFLIPLKPLENVAVNKEALENYLRNMGAEEIFKEYDKKGTLSKEKRRLMVNLTVTDMRGKFGIKPSKSVKIKYAQAIIELFPNLRDPMGKYGYESFYDPDNRGGYLAWRLRTINRKENKRERDSDEPLEKKSKNESLQVCLDLDTNEDIVFIKNASPKDPLLKGKFKQTFEIRRNFPSDKNILAVFPRFLDTPGLIEYDFSLMFPTFEVNFEIEFWNIKEKLFAIYKTDVQNPAQELIDESPDNWDESSRALLILMSLLPPTAKGNKKCLKEPVKQLSERLLTFKPLNTPYEEIIKKKKTNQPFLIASGESKGNTQSYVICVDNKILAQETVNNICQAFDLLFKTYFVLNLRYDIYLENFFKFVQVFFYKLNIGEVQFTPTMRELRAKLML